MTPLTRASLGSWQQFLLALASGLLLALGFAPWNLWPCTILGVAVMTWLAAGRRGRRGFGLGMLAGVTYFGATIWWVGAQAGPVVWALVVVMALWIGLVGMATSYLAKLRCWMLLVPCAWGAVEFGTGQIPFGGFPWQRLGFTTIDQPLAGWLPFLGTPGATWFVAFAGCCVLAVAAGPRRWLPALSAAGVFATGGLLLLIPVAQPQETVNVGMVQGNVELGELGGYIAATGATPHHLSETVFLLAEARATGRPLDLIVWAENSTDTDPTLNRTTHAQVTAAVELAQVPIFVGALTSGPEPDTRQTTSQVWVPGTGITAQYHKRNLAPFGEFVPLRDILEPLFPAVKRAGDQSIPGTGPGVVTIPVAGHPDLQVGTVICYELAYDQTVYDTVVEGAQILVAQSTTHNFSGSSEPWQQMTINRVRAAELRRDFVATTLNGYSGLIDAKGQVHEPTREYTAAHRIYTVPLRDNVTLAVHAAPVLSITHLVVVIAAIVVAVRMPSKIDRNHKAVIIPKEPQ
ncbi:MAG: apolipoprotein N-acyltransferase [Propionibacteriaceae bacterium]|nr:apolipoprotein N-acyltransferase [Propionibacteriaceae bacterium]